MEIHAVINGTKYCERRIILSIEYSWRSFMKRLLLIILLFLFSLLLVNAEEGFDDQGNPNDPAINERANACYDGGEWEGMCDTEIEWIGGWYRIRLRAGIFAPEDIPAWLYWILDSETVEIDEDNSWGGIPAGCYFLGGVGGQYFKWPGGFGPSALSDAYVDSACTIVDGFWFPRVAARNQARADAICGSTAFSPVAMPGTGGGSFWRCS
jgi:hypothetical protein